MNDVPGGSDALTRLAELAGILPSYADTRGEQHFTPPETKRALLAAMGISAKTDAEVLAAVTAREEREWRGRLAPVAVFAAGGPALAIEITLQEELAGQPLPWLLTAERGQSWRGEVVPATAVRVAERTVEGTRFARFCCELPVTAATLGLGYHRFELQSAEATATTLIVAPARCYEPPALASGGRVWGPGVQLYSVRSRRNWGIGDLTDLKHVVEFAAAAGAGTVGLNPLHALSSIAPQHASPYNPTSRVFGNPLYIDVEAIPEFAECESARRAVANPEFQTKLRWLREGELVGYRVSFAAKREIMELVYRCFRARHRGRGDARDRAFAAFLQKGGAALRRHALYEAIAEKMHADGVAGAGDWRQWPAAFRDAQGNAVSAFAATHSERVEFHAYLQWQFDAQLAEAAERVSALGLSIGLLQDLAIGIDPGGSESWSDPALFATGAHIGAPPDLYNPAGQNWGLPPLIPDRLRDTAYAPFIATLRASMRAAGALRIDHVMGLLRLYWVPAGAPADAGAYVRYPFEDLLGILALESQRNRCVIVGEDLGTVPDEVRAGLARVGVLSSWPLYFAHDADGEFIAPESFPRDAVVSVGTHDLATLKGFWVGADLDAREALKSVSVPEERYAQNVERTGQRRRVLHALQRESLLPPGIDPYHAAHGAWSPVLGIALERYLARSPAKILLVAMEDLLEQLEQVNLPGTVDELPNWRRKLPRELEDWAEDDNVRALVAALRTERPTPQVAPRIERTLSPDVPRATYRLQLNSGFTFAAATEVIPYLDALGMSHVYLSPYFKARPGSLHGYDVLDHNALNPEIGTREELDRLCSELRKHGMEQVLDIVPNHVGVLGGDNGWWHDVLENGRSAAHAGFFDIDWDRSRDELHGKLLLPVLGEPYGIVLERGDVALAFDSQNGKFSVRYGEQRFPLDPQTYVLVLKPAAARLRSSLETNESALADEFENLAIAFAVLPKTSETAPERIAQRRRDQELNKRRLAEMCVRSPAVLRSIEEELREVNGRAGEPASFDALDALHSAQVFRLASWRVAADDINYRRFFDINELAALRMEDPAVFEATHRLVYDLVARGQVRALRVDHPDGLYDPAEYFARLQRSAAERLHAGAREGESALPLYLVAEKITAPYEQLPAWPIAGTTGYDFANLVNGLFVASEAEAKLTRSYFACIGERLDFDEILYRSKKLIMDVALASELNALSSALTRIAQSNRATRDFTHNRLRAALIEILACFPVYRTYVTATQVSSEDRRFIEWAVNAARKRARAAEATVFDFVREVLTTDLAKDRLEAERARIVRFAMRFQQFCSPVMAKGMEDTAFYVYNRLASLNDVGGDPRRFGVSVAAFHHTNAQRARQWPHAMLNTSTHDSKRSEDVRARIDVLSEMTAEWRLHVARWRRMARSYRREVDDAEAPTGNDEYLLYQTLLGSWPRGDDASAVRAEFEERIERYLIKVVREAKIMSSWIHPNEAYEEALLAYARALLTAPGNEPFMTSFLPFQRRVAWFGMLNSLAQTLLKLTSPGVPDIYQGCELWNLTLVDPDNRRPIDYATRRESLAAMQEAASAGGGALAAVAGELLRSIDDGRIKQFVIWRALALRRERERLFRDGSYVPLAVSGSSCEHVCAYARVWENDCVLVIAPRLACTLLGGEARLPIGSDVWTDTSVDVSTLPVRGWRNALTSARVEASAVRNGALRVGELLDAFPLALLAAEDSRA